MEGQHEVRRRRRYNPLFVLFLCLIAAVIILLITAVFMGVRLGKTGRDLKAAQKQVNELEQTIAQLEDDLETARGNANALGGNNAEPTEPAPEQAPAQQPVQQPAQQPVQQTEPKNEPKNEPKTDSSSWLDLTGHSEIAVKPSNLLSGYQTYYTSEGVNLRSGPGTGYGRITTVNRGTAVKVAAREGGWSFVSVGGKFGWISSDYLSKTTPPPVTTQTTRTEATSGSLKTH